MTDQHARRDDLAALIRRTYIETNGAWYEITDAVLSSLRAAPDASDVDSRLTDFAAYFLGDQYKVSPPLPEEAEGDMRTLVAQLKATVDDWLYAKYDGERD